MMNLVKFLWSLFLQKDFQKEDKLVPDEEAVIINLHHHGASGVLDKIQQFEDAISTHADQVGFEVDGHEMSQVDASIYLYGRDANKIYNSIKSSIGILYYPCDILVRQGSASNLHATVNHYTHNCG